MGSTGFQNKSLPSVTSKPKARFYLIFFHLFKVSVPVERLLNRMRAATSNRADVAASASTAAFAFGTFGRKGRVEAPHETGTNSGNPQGCLFFRGSDTM